MTWTADDYTVEIRDSKLRRVGMLGVQDLTGFQFTEDAQDVGAWSLNIPAGTRVADLLVQPGAGIIVTPPDGRVFSGPCTSVKWVSGTDGELGDHWELTGCSDAVVLSRVPCLPEPDKAPGEQQYSEYVWEGKRDDLMVRAMGCLSVWYGSAYTESTGIVVSLPKSDGVGTRATITVNWQSVLEACQALATRDWRFWAAQDSTGSGVTLHLERGADLSHSVFYDTTYGGLSGFQTTRNAPAHTRVIYKWSEKSDSTGKESDSTTSGETLHYIVPSNVAELQNMESDYGPHILVTDLSGDNIKTLADAKAMAEQLSAQDSAQTMLAMNAAQGSIADDSLLEGVHAGDKVGVSDGTGDYMTAVISSVSTGFSDGVVHSATLGDWTESDSRLALARRIQQQQRQIDALLRR